jgi:hypothetical protein
VSIDESEIAILDALDQFDAVAAGIGSEYGTIVQREVIRSNCDESNLSQAGKSPPLSVFTKFAM